MLPKKDNIPGFAAVEMDKSFRFVLFLIIPCLVNITAMFLKWFVFNFKYFESHKIRNEKGEIITNTEKVQYYKNFCITNLMAFKAWMETTSIKVEIVKLTQEQAAQVSD